MYNYPNHWDPSYIWDDVSNAAATADITAIVNPSNGPGVGGPNSDYVVGMNTLRNAGVKMLGYIHTSYGDRSINDVKADIDQWASLFNVHGIFVDEVDTVASDLSYYEEVVAYVESKTWASGLSKKTQLNFGTIPDTAYFNSAALSNAILQISESDETAWDAWSAPAAVLNGNHDRFAALVHGVNSSSMNQVIAAAKSRNLGHIYVTDRTLASNPWNGLPSFWSDLVAALAQ